jgi:Putative peptidoglycan binding domain
MFHAMIFSQTACFSVGVTNHGMTLRLRLMRACIGPLVLALAQISVAHPAHAVGRVAMVLVAEDYVGLNRSQVGIKRGNEIAEQLRARGFEVIFVANPTNAMARAALHDFSAKVSGADLSLAVLIGHGTASGDQTFFLPTNAAIERSTDLRTRGLSIANIANIVNQARVGGVCFLMTSPRFANAVDGIDMRPHFDVDVAKNIVAAFSHSDKVPVSGIDAVAGLAANEIVDLLQKKPHSDLRQLIDACASQQGSVYGSPAAVDLAPPVTVTAETQGKDEFARQLKLEKEARETAEKQAREADARARQAQAEAREAEEHARRQFEDELARQLKTEKEAREQAQKQKEAAEKEKREAEERANQAEKREAEERVRRQFEEGLLDPHKVRVIQRVLAKMGLYEGYIDAIVGPLTRNAIKRYQRLNGSQETGYLTPDELRALTSRTP